VGALLDSLVTYDKRTLDVALSAGMPAVARGLDGR
jgi:hypothetical protein